MDPVGGEVASPPEDEIGRCAVIVPAYNEGRMIGQVLRETRRVFPWVVVVDDGSSDDTASEARAAGAVVLRHPVNVGQGGALETGIRFCLDSGAEYFITMDADGQHRSADAMALLTHFRQKRGDLDIVLGSRFLGQPIEMGFRRRILLRTATWVSRLLHGLALTDTHNGLRVFGRTVAEKMRFSHVDMAHASDVYDIIRKYHFRFEERPVVIRYTDYSQSKGQPMVNAINVLIDFLFNRVK
jgi:glycosyltransferase involved in cell wall biosynthesis